MPEIWKEKVLVFGFYMEITGDLLIDYPVLSSINHGSQTGLGILVDWLLLFGEERGSGVKNLCIGVISFPWPSVD